MSTYIITSKWNSSFGTIATATVVKMTAKTVDKNAFDWMVFDFFLLRDIENDRVVQPNFERVVERCQRIRKYLQRVGKRFQWVEKRFTVFSMHFGRISLGRVFARLQTNPSHGNGYKTSCST